MRAKPGTVETKNNPRNDRGETDTLNLDTSFPHIPGFRVQAYKYCNAFWVVKKLRANVGK